MNTSCLICTQSISHNAAPFLCSICYKLFKPANTHSEYSSLYRYNNALRNLILKVKIHGNYRSLACLKYLFLNSPISNNLAKSCDLIIPAPSSLWSRLRGRIDLAWLLAYALASHHNIKIEPAPLRLHWQLKKRSKTFAREKILSAGEFKDMSGKKTVLIIDDVVTSGHTLQRTASAIKAENCRFLTLASAFHT